MICRAYLMEQKSTRHIYKEPLPNQKVLYLNENLEYFQLNIHFTRIHFEIDAPCMNTHMQYLTRLQLTKY